jgi:hypothetical protein
MDRTLKRSKTNFDSCGTTGIPVIFCVHLSFLVLNLNTKVATLELLLAHVKPFKLEVQMTSQIRHRILNSSGPRKGKRGPETIQNTDLKRKIQQSPNSTLSNHDDCKIDSSLFCTISSSRYSKMNL